MGGAVEAREQDGATLSEKWMRGGMALNRIAFHRGIIEGFYGRPWTPAARSDMLAFARTRGFTHYIYAAKDDPYTRADWRSVPLPADRERWWRQELARAQAGAMRLGMAIQPGLDMRFGSARDRRTLSEKVRYLRDLGLGVLALQFDDIDPSLSADDARAYGQAANAQADIARLVHEELRGEAELIFCPTEYWGLRATPYKQALRTALPAEIPVFWTGPAVCSETIRGRQAAQAQDLFGHAIMVWDNYPVNDAGMTAELHLAPLEGRDAALLDTVAGYYTNPMELAEASKVALVTIAAYLSDANAYDPVRAWRQALDQWGADYRASLEDLGWATRFSCCGRGSRWETRLAQARGHALDPELEDRLRLWAHRGEHAYPPALWPEIAPWAEKLRGLAVRALSTSPTSPPPHGMGPVPADPPNPAGPLVLGGELERWIQSRGATPPG